jgi:predicted transcriptional regulator
MKRDPIEIVYSIAEPLRRLQSGETIRINEVAEQADLHWMTASRYLELVEFIQTKLPRLAFEQVGELRAVRITSNPWLDLLSPEDRTLVRLMRAQAGTSKSAISLNADEKSIISTLLEKGLVRQTESGSVFLTPTGASRAVGVTTPQLEEYEGAVSAIAASGQLPGLNTSELERRVREFVVTLSKEMLARADVPLMPPSVQTGPTRAHDWPIRPRRAHGEPGGVTYRISTHSYKRAKGSSEIPTPRLRPELIESA